jgi:glycine cleavage system aminomethyltransferase T
MSDSQSWGTEAATDFASLGAGVEKRFPLFTTASYDERVDYYLNSRVTGLGFGSAVPMQYSGWREEVMSWKTGVYIHAGLNDAPTFRVSGPDALRFFSETSVNSFANFPVDGVKHCIMCREDGLIMAHGVLLRLAEDVFQGYYLAPYAAYKFYTGGYDAVGEWIDDEVIYQVAGPRSLETLELASGECLHDIAFARLRTAHIAGHEVRVLRMGMAGTLAYEVHAKKDLARLVYNSIVAAGAEFNIQKLGFYAYQLSHTEDGFPQGFMHFSYPWGEDQGMMDFLHMPGFSIPCRGSMGADMSLRYRNPVELGWTRTIRFDHDFIGRKALEREVAAPRRAMVTLVWDRSDVLEVFASQLEPGEHYLPMEPSHFGQRHGAGELWADKVLAPDSEELIGVSSGRNYSYYYRQMLSLCSLDVAHAVEGTTVEVLWGEKGTRQKRIKAVVSRFPYLNENRNEDVDVSSIPCRAL